MGSLLSIIRETEKELRWTYYIYLKQTEPEPTNRWNGHFNGMRELAIKIIGITPMRVDELREEAIQFAIDGHFKIDLIPQETNENDGLN